MGLRFPQSGQPSALQLLLSSSFLVLEIFVDEEWLVVLPLVPLVRGAVVHILGRDVGRIGRLLRRLVAADAREEIFGAGQVALVAAVQRVDEVLVLSRCEGRFILQRRSIGEVVRVGHVYRGARVEGAHDRKAEHREYCALENKSNNSIVSNNSTSSHLQKTETPFSFFIDPRNQRNKCGNNNVNFLRLNLNQQIGFTPSLHSLRTV